MAFYEYINRFNGAVSGFLALFAAFFSTLITTIFSIIENPSFNIEYTPMSDLGVAPSGFGVIFCFGMILTGFFQIPFYKSLYRKFKEDNFYPLLAKTAEVISISSSICLIILGIFPFYEENFLLYSIHGAASSMNCIGNSVAFLIYGVIEIKFLKLLNPLTIISLITSSLLFTVWVSGFIVRFNILNIPSLHYTIQWVSFFNIILWTLIHSIFLFRT